MSSVFERVTKYAAGVIELDDFNNSIVNVEQRQSPKLNIISIVGKNGLPDKCSLTEIAIGRANPWGGSKVCSWLKRSRTSESYSFPDGVRNALVILLRDIAWSRMRHWKSGGIFHKTKYLTRGIRRSRVILMRTGIRFAFDHRDEELINFLRWHETLRNRDLAEYLAYRAKGIELAIRKLPAAGFAPRGKKKKRPAAAGKILWYFQNSKTLRDPYTQVVLLENYEDSHPLVAFLEAEGIIDERFWQLRRRRPSLREIPLHDTQVRYIGKRKNGNVVFQIYPTQEYWERSR